MTRCLVYDLGLIPYREALQIQRKTVAELQRGRGEEALFLLEHPHVVTLGRSGSVKSLLLGREQLTARGIELFETDRGGDVTYHGPGQLVGYPILSLEPGRQDIRRYVIDVESALIGTLADHGLESDRHAAYRGVWIENRKIASVGIRISRWVTCHGFALNVSTDLAYFSVITPCGIEGCRMTSMHNELGRPVDMQEVKQTVTRNFARVFERLMVPGELPV
jgi:lipoyl(octanoyl) transferase